MAWRLAIAALVMSALAWAGDPPAPVCAPGEFAATSGCTPSPDDVRAAKDAFKQGLKYESQDKLDRAFDAFEYAQKLVPQHPEYASAHEIVRQRLVMTHLERGNFFLAEKRQVEALAEFRSAVELDPTNEFAQQRLRDAVGDDAPQLSAGLKLVQEAGETELAPQPGTHDFHYRGDTRGLIDEIARAFGVTATYDASFSARPVRFEVQGADFRTAMGAAGKLGKSFWTPLSSTEMLVAADTPENRRQYERMSVRTYYLSGVNTAEEMNQVAGIFRQLFDVRFVATHPEQSLIQVRGPKSVLDAATKLIEDTAQRRPQVMLDVKVYEVDYHLLRQMGVELPLQARIFNIPSAALILQQSPDIQQLINQLIASGGLNQANAGDLAALLAALQSQQNGIFSQPFATFGGGLTLTGISIPPVTLHLNHNESSVQMLEHMTLRAADGKQATFMVGQRYPILNASFSPIFNTPALAQVIANNSFRAAFPSFTFQDLGITLKATPQVHGTGEITLALATSIKALGTQSFNGIPVLSNREYTGTVRLREGESALVFGYVTAAESKALSGLPGLSHVPGLAFLTSTGTKQVDETEIMLMVTPHIIAPGESGSGPEVWLPAAGKAQ
ncbi:MAG TPA: type II and III secretion system protein [Terriglobales bacterium]|nr:type II and III secretion system protein [Terriglobales bacterium]